MRIALPQAIDARAFADRDSARPVVALDGETMGTSWRVLFARPAACDPAGVRAAITARLDDLVAQMSHWEPDSLLSRFNRAPAGSWWTLPPDFAQVVATALRIAERSGGAFDPAIGRLVNLWGFGPEPAVSPPARNPLARALADGGWRRLIFHAEAQRLQQPGGLALDLSGIAKGYAVDAIADLLEGRGIRHCLVEIGGELVGRGIRPDGDPWWVELEVPPGATLPLLRIALHRLAVATSGDYRRGAHTLDPRTGRPTTNGVLSVSVLHATAMEADAWATALAVLGPAFGPAAARAAGLAARMVAMIDGQVFEELTPALQAMIED